MNISQAQLENICNKAYKYYLDIFGKYIDSPRNLVIKMDSQYEFPSDKVKVPACTHAVNKDYIINFNIPILLTIFPNNINLICWHEVAHVVCDELYRCNPEIKQDKNVHGGHPVLFFKVINSWKDKSISDINLQHERHEIPYNYGLSEGFDSSYNPLNELRISANKFSTRINKIFG